MLPKKQFYYKSSNSEKLISWRKGVEPYAIVCVMSLGESMGQTTHKNISDEGENLAEGLLISSTPVVLTRLGSNWS